MAKTNHQLNIHKLNIGTADKVLVGFLVVLLVLVSVFFQVYNHRAKENQLELIRMVMEQSAKNQKAQFGAYVQDKIQTLTEVASFPQIYEMNEEEQRTFIKGKSFGFHHVFIMNKNGVGYYVDEGVRREQQDEDFYRDVMENDIFITKPFYAHKDIVLVTASVSIYDERGEKVGALCGAVNLSEAQRLIEKNEMILDGMCCLFDRKGTYLASQNQELVYNKVSIFDEQNSDVGLLKKAFAYKEDQQGFIVLDGEDYLAQVSYLKEYDWIIAEYIPVDTIVKRYEMVSRVYYGVILLLVTLGICIGRVLKHWKETNKKLYTDTLTKCNSRTACIGIMDKLEDFSDKDLTIVYMDLNKFKYVNDTYGHDEGDNLLCLFSAALMKCFGEIGFVGRMGGDEFIGIFMDLEKGEIESMWEMLEVELKEQSKSLSFDYVITSSYGYATRKAGEKISLHEVLQLADQNMYENKVAKNMARV